MAMRVTWETQADTVVDTEDEQLAREQVESLFQNAQWGDRDGNEQCRVTYQRMRVRSVEQI